jgi:hypothetical protein
MTSLFVRRALRWSAALAFLLAVSVSLAGHASAHIGHTIARAERYLKLDATEADTRFVVSITLGEDEGIAVLADVDTDRDGQVSAGEADAYLATWADGLRDELPIEIDGTPIVVEWTEGWLDPLGAVRRVPVTVEMVAHLPLDARDHHVVVRDRMVRREVFDRTDVSFRAHDGAELVHSGASEQPSGIEEDIGFTREGPTLDVLAADVRYPERSAFDVRLLIALAVVLSLALLVGYRLFTRRPKRP